MYRQAHDNVSSGIAWRYITSLPDAERNGSFIKCNRYVTALCGIIVLGACIEGVNKPSLSISATGDLSFNCPRFPLCSFCSNDAEYKNKTFFWTIILTMKARRIHAWDRYEVNLLQVLAHIIVQLNGLTLESSVTSNLSWNIHVEYATGNADRLLGYPKRNVFQSPFLLKLISHKCLARSKLE